MVDSHMTSEVTNKKPPKQVIVLRKFGSMRTGKYCAQAAHAAMGALFAASKTVRTAELFSMETDCPVAAAWLHGRFIKICLYVQSEEELLRLERECHEAGLPCALIKDAGFTEFKGVPTYTALGIGPACAEDIDAITGKLPLF